MYKYFVCFGLFRFDNKTSMMRKCRRLGRVSIDVQKCHHWKTHSGDAIYCRKHQTLSFYLFIVSSIQKVRALLQKMTPLCHFHWWDILSADFCFSITQWDDGFFFWVRNAFVDLKEMSRSVEIHFLCDL